MSGRSHRFLARTRWVSVGTVAALLLGSGGLLTASASSSPGASSFVPITPCRLFDTRPSSLVGARNTPLGSGATFTASAWGTNGNCTIPSGVTGLSMNVVAINGSASSFLTVYPADKPLPVSSNLNWVTGDPPTPNAVTVALSADGRVSFFNFSGTVDLAVDVVGYYETDGGGGPAGPPGPAGPAAPRPLRVVWVAKSGGDFTSLTAALASITDNDGFHPYLIRIAPGLYAENSGFDLKDYVDIEGSGQDTTVLFCGTCGSESIPFTDGASAVLRATGTNLHSEVRRLTVANLNGASTYNTAIWIGDVAGGVRLDHVGATAIAAAGNFAYGVGIVRSQVTIEALSASVTGAGMTTGVSVVDTTSNVVIRDSSIRGNFSILRLAPARVAAFDTVLNGASQGMVGHCFNVVDISLTLYNCT